MIFHVEAARLTSMPTHLNGMTRVGFRVKLSIFAPMRRIAGETNTWVLLDMKLCPLMTSPLWIVAMRNARTIVHTHLPKLHVFHIAVIWILGQYITMNTLKILLSIVLHTIPDHALEGMQAFIPQLLAWDNMTCQRAFILSQTNLHILLQHWKARTTPLDHHLKMLVGQRAPPLHEAGNTMILDKPPQIHKKITMSTSIPPTSPTTMITEASNVL